MTEDQDRDDQGQFDAKYSVDAFIEAIEAVEIATADAVADEVGCHPNTARHRLDQFEAEGVVERDRIGNTFIWRTV